MYTISFFNVFGYPASNDALVNILLDLDDEFILCYDRRNRDHALALAFALTLAVTFDLGLDVDSANYAKTIGFLFNADSESILDQLISFACNQSKEIKTISLQKSLEELRSQRPTGENTKETWNTWAEKLREVMIRERNIGHDWNFGKEQDDCISSYLYAINLMVDCMNCESYVTKSVREEIENTLLLPSG